MNPAAILSLIIDLYTQIAQLRQENDGLKAKLAASVKAENPSPEAAA